MRKLEFSEPTDDEARELERFDVLARMGQTAVNLSNEVERVYESMKLLGEMDYILEADRRFCVATNRTEDPMYVQHFESVDEFEGEFPELELPDPTWNLVSPGAYWKYDCIEEDPGNRNERAFIGKSIKYDSQEQKIWVYDNEGTTRVEYSDGMMLEILEVEASVSSFGDMLGSFSDN